MKKIIKSFWGCVPFAVFLLCLSLVAIVQAIPDNTLRSLPRNILICFGVGSFGILLLWVNIKFSTFCEKADNTILRIISMLAKMLSVFVLAVLVLVSIFVMGFSYRPEHIVTRNGIKMVASVNSFLDETVYYHQYKNWLFYGKQLGYEYYGSGGNDPLAQTPERVPVEWCFYDLEGNLIETGSNKDTYPSDNDIEKNSLETILQQEADMKELNIEVMDNREDELVFSFSIEDFIDSYNGYYWNDKNSRYLLPSSEWRCSTYETGIHSSHETLYYNFTEDEKIWSLPTISVYVPTNADYIQEITVNFDEHSYTESMYELYEQMCFYTLKMFFPDLSNEAIIDLYTEANKLGNINVFSSENWYSSESVPCALFYKDGIGVYPYFAIGDWEYLCIVPVTQETIAQFEQEGVEIIEIK